MPKDTVLKLTEALEDAIMLLTDYDLAKHSRERFETVLQEAWEALDNA